jgi:peptidoglycan/xylan/chitin deacetylase (PgdA/CDA1 family)
VAQRADLSSARRRLQDALEVPVDLFAYPNGRAEDFNAASIVAACEAGHSYAITTIEGFHRTGADPYQVRRSVVYPERGVREIAVTALLAWHRGRRPAPIPAGAEASA